jgi:hypothetical protein
MYRIDSRGATGDGRFTEGNPTTGTPATVVNAQWMNAVQDEVVNVIEGAGIDLEKTNSTQLLAAINALATAQVRGLYPVGSVYVNASDSRNPALIFGFGTWVAIAGRAIFGFSASETEFDSAGETGGSKTHNHGGTTGGTAITIDQMPNHNHNMVAGVTAAGYLTGTVDGNANPSGNVTTGSNGGGQAHDHSVSTVSNLPPYFTAFVWRRTA